MTNIVFFGIPAAGKGTQSKLLSTYYNIPHISTGDIFRENMEQKTPLGIKIDVLMRAGDLVPDDLTNEIVQNKLSGLNDWILDGYPRTIEQSELFDKYLKSSKIEAYFFFLQLSENEAIKRSKERFIKENRFEDASDEVVKRRIKNYYDLTQKAIEYFSNHNNFYPLDATKTPEEIFNQVKKFLQLK